MTKTREEAEKLLDEYDLSAEEFEWRGYDRDGRFGMARAAVLDAMIGEWQPIETAPNDVDLLLYSRWNNEDCFEVGFAGSTIGDWRNYSATHWMPLPSPPRSEP